MGFCTEDEDVVFLQVVQKQLRKSQHCQTQSYISCLENSPACPLSLPQPIHSSPQHSCQARHPMIHSNIPPALWCKILFREWHPFWHLRFFFYWNLKHKGRELLPATEVRAVPSVLNYKISSGNTNSQCPRGKILPAFLYFWQTVWWLKPVWFPQTVFYSAKSLPH